MNDVVVDEGDALSKSAVETTAILAEEGDKFACPSCKGKVFPAEKMSTSNGVVFHKKCFVCQVCTYSEIANFNSPFVLI